jgi:hypothetical protein
MMIPADFIITIAPKEVEILRTDSNDSSKNTVFLKRRTMSAMHYPSSNGERYTVWKLGDRKMVMRKINNIQYLSVYQADEFGLPAEYVTFIIKD